MPTAVEVNELVQQWWPLASGLARKAGARFPWLTDCFTSVAGEALWRLATTHGQLEAEHFAGYVRKAVGWAIVRRLKQEHLHNPAAFDRAHAPADAEGAELLDLLADAGADPIERADAAEAVAVLMDRANLTPRQSELVQRHFYAGESQAALGAEQRVTRTRARQVIGAALVKLRAAAG